MKKKIFCILLSVFMIGLLAGCKSESADPMSELLKDPYGDYREKGGEIAFVLNGSIGDGNYNEAIYEGIQMYALAAGASFSYYQTEDDSPDGHSDAIELAAENEAQIIICAGYDFQESVGELQDVYPEVSFLLIDGVSVGKDGKPVEISDNVHCISFREEESGYLAGYLAVLEGFRELGFIGGKEESPSVVRYGYGFLQGINAAADELGLGKEEISVNYWYSGSFLPEQKTKDMAAKWYEEGTKVIFACGGGLYESVLEAADEADGLLIGVDVDQSPLSERFLTSAVKDVTNGVILSLDDYYATGKKWSDAFAGQEVRYGAMERCTGLPVSDTEWRFKNVTAEEYDAIYKRMRQGELSVSDEIERKPQVAITVNYL